MHSCLGFDGAECIDRSAAFIFAVPLGHATRFHRNRLTNLTVKNDCFLIHADHRLLGGKWPFIDLQYVFHPLNVFFVQFGNAPYFFPATAGGRGLATKLGWSRVRSWEPTCASPPLRPPCEPSNGHT